MSDDVRSISEVTGKGIIGAVTTLISELNVKKLASETNYIDGVTLYAKIQRDHSCWAS